MDYEKISYEPTFEKYTYEARKSWLFGWVFIYAVATLFLSYNGGQLTY